MDIVNTIIPLAIVVLLVIAIAIVFIIQGYLEAKYNLRGRLTGKSKKKSTTFLDEGEDEKKCDICYGKIDADPIAKCACGKMFHDACAKPTGSCPYCGAGYGSMEVREPERTRCPVCGRFMKGSICDCGAVIPKKDETFVCKCGGTVDTDKPVCKKCGAVYESVTMKIYKEQK
ncbi:MAG: hypothetical protein LBR42_01315 [Candidatus Methanoplasma sp.]|jgi:hypothetical protein|nr:hypothetical protein [Candidatus Methanoplasma sp.]